MSTVYYNFALRVDGADSAPLVEWLRRDGGSFFVVKELQDSNPHFHVLLHSAKKLTALRMSFRRAFPDLNGNGKYSLSEVKDLDKYERYMCKGDAEGVVPAIVASNGIRFNGEWVAQRHEDYWERNREVRENRLSKLTVLEACIEECKEKRVLWGNRDAIAEVYIRELVARNKPINLFSVKSAINLVQVKLCPDDSAILALANSCANF